MTKFSEKHCRLLFLLFLLLCALDLTAEPALRIRVSDQEAFEHLNRSVREALSEREAMVEVLLDSGVYYYHDRHLDLQGISAEGKRLSIHGNGAVLYPAMEEAAGKEFDPDAAYYSESGGRLRPVYAPEPMQKAHFLVRVVNRRKKICCLRINEELGEYAVRNGYIYLTQWFRGRTYKITGVKGRRVYFLADDLFQKRLLFNVNLDWTFSMQWPRYRLVNCREKSGELPLKKGMATTFLSIAGSQMGALTLSGLRFVGNRRDGTDEWSALIRIDSVQCPTRIQNCCFEHVRSDCIRIRVADDVTVDSCCFTYCYRRCTFASESVSNVVFENNRVSSSGLCGDNVVVIHCCADRFRISGNTISDFGYGAISSGEHYTIQKTGPIRGVISGNEIFQTPEYFRQAPLNLLMDSGAIYLATQSDLILIRDNYIHDINGPTYNRGIFADDGASHLHIIHNRIERIQNYYAIDIDPRSAFKMKWRRDRKVPISEISVGNVVRDNEVDGRSRLPGKPAQ